MQEHGCTIEEWAFPTSTLWSEHKHLQSFDAQYTSKLDAFRALVDRSKLTALPFAPVVSTGDGPASQPRVASQRNATASASTSQTSNAEALQRVTVISDFPHLNGPDAREQLRELLVLLAHTAAHPVFHGISSIPSYPSFSVDNRKLLSSRFSPILTLSS